MYCVKWKMTIWILTDREIYLIFKDYYGFCIDIIIYNILFLNIFQLNSIITRYVCVQLIKCIYIYIFVYLLCRIKFY